jgi:hypothetical protein
MDQWEVMEVNKVVNKGAKEVQTDKETQMDKAAQVVKEVRVVKVIQTIQTVKEITPIVLLMVKEEKEAEMETTVKIMDINKPQVHKKVDIIQMIHQQVNLRVD